MLDFNLPEMAVVAIVALVVIGPKDLPKAMRIVGYWLGRARGVARQFRAGFDEMVREAELAEMEKKWQAENERIMRMHAPDAEPDSLPPPDDASPSDYPAAPATPADEADAAPVMVEKPVVVPAPDAAPAPPENGKAPS